MAEEDRLRKKQIRVHLSEEEYNLLERKCNECNMNKSDFIRQEIICNGTIIIYQPFAIKEVCKEISAIGNNINQIARKANETHCVKQDDVDMLRKEFDNLFNLYIEKVMGR